MTRLTIRDLASGPEDLRAQLPIGAATTAIRTAFDGTGQFFCARLDAPMKWRYGPELDTAACAAQYLGRDRDEQRPDRFQVGQKLDAMVIGFDRSKKPNFSVKARQLAEEKEAVEQYGSSDAGASLGDILGAALKAKKD